MRVFYTSPVFKNADGSACEFVVPLAGLSTYQKRDAALIGLMELGGIHAQKTPQFVALHKKMMSAKRKIAKNGWFCETVKG